MTDSRDFISRLKASSVSPEDLLKFHNIINELPNAEDLPASIQLNKEFLLRMLEYFVDNMDNPNIDPLLLQLLCLYLGIKPRLAEKKKEIAIEEEWEELTEEERKRLLLLIFYEAYKIINPNRIAGETAAENFLNNVLYRGLRKALEIEGVTSYKSQTSLDNPTTFAERLRAEGFIEAPRGRP